MKSKNKNLTINDDKLYFILFIIHAIAEKYNISPKKVYRILSATDIIDNYIVSCYDVLHSMGKLAIVEDIEEYLRNRGKKIC